MVKKVYIYIGIILILLGCSEYTKLMKVPDSKLVFQKGIEYANNGDYTRAEALLSRQIVSLKYRYSKDGDKLTYYRGLCNYKLKKYQSASYYFSTLRSSYAQSQYLDSGTLMLGDCYYQLSPRVTLDQTFTEDAIEVYTEYIELFPSSPKVPFCMELVEELSDKLIYKEILAGEFYMNLEDYRAADIVFTNLFQTYPDSKYREDILYYTIDANYHVGMNSIFELQRNRLIEAYDFCFVYLENYPEGQFTKQVNELKKLLEARLGYDNLDEKPL